MPRSADLSSMTPSTTHQRLYISHALSTWNSRAFEFGAYLFLATIFPGTLLPASIYALARAAAAALLSPWLGGYLDSTDRLVAVRLSIIGQRVSVACSCVGLLALLYVPKLATSSTGTSIFLLLLSALACVEKLGAILNTIAVERDWVVVIADGEETRLANLNAQMRRIDLFCKLVGPVMISIVDSYSTVAAVVVTGGMSSASALIEYYAIARVYRTVPALQAPKPAPVPSDARPSYRARPAFSLVSNYVRHTAFLPSVSLALLYLTVLSFSGQLITYLLARGLSSASIAVLRAIAAVLEMSATWLGPKLVSRIGTIRAGIWFLNAELLFVAVASAVLWLPLDDSKTMLATTGLVIAVILSRTGLWGFDLSAQLIIQDEVEPEFRGTFASLESSLQNVFEMLAFASTVVFSSPEQFKYPSTISTIAVASAAVLYACFVRNRRGHLIHACKCLVRQDRAKKQTQQWQRIPQDEETAEDVELESRQ